MPLISAFERQRQEHHKFKVNLSSVAITYHKMKKGWENTLVHRVAVVQAWGPELNPQDASYRTKHSSVPLEPQLWDGLPGAHKPASLSISALSSAVRETVSENTASDPKEWRLRSASGCHTHTRVPSHTYTHTYLPMVHTHEPTYTCTRTYSYAQKHKYKLSKETFSLLRIQI